MLSHLSPRAALGASTAVAALAMIALVPVLRDGVVIAVIDLDSPVTGRFDAVDAAGIEALAAAISQAV